MKKLIIIAIASMLSATTAFGYAKGDKLDRKTATLQELNEVANVLLTVTSQVEVAKINDETGFFKYFPHKESQEELTLNHRVDDALSAKGFGISPYAIHSFPKMSAIARSRNTGVDANSILFILGRKYNVDAYAIKLQFYCTTEELVSLMDYCASHPRNLMYKAHGFNRLKKQFQKKHALKLVKKMLYNQGKSFVTKDGVNPCEPMMKRLTACFNAPRLEGFNQWLSDVGVSNRVDLTFLPSDAEIQRMKQAILIGEEDVTPLSLFNLYLGLSVDEYNAFIKRYNGEN